MSYRFRAVKIIRATGGPPADLGRAADKDGLPVRLDPGITVPNHQMVVRLGDRPRPARLRSESQVEHLTGGHVVEMESWIFRGVAGQCPMELDHRLAEQHPLVRLRGPVGVELDEKPVGAAWHLHPRPQPQVQPR